MLEINAFCAIRFDQQRLSGDLSTVIAPPYDVLDQGDKDALLARSEHNIVAIDLPHLPPKSLGPDEVYQASADRLAAWRAQGVLVQEDQPALYLYHQVFEHDGAKYTRRMFVARVRAQAFGEGDILPHEQTFGGPKQDRLALMKATKCQLSAIFGLYTDPEDRIGDAFAKTAAQPPNVTADLNDVNNRMWIVTDPGVIDTVVGAMTGRKIYIADGHHRYGTALDYRAWLTQQAGKELPADHPANFVMFVLASMDDPGSLIIAYNRTLCAVDLDTVQNAWRAGTERVEDRADADVVLHEGSTGKEVTLRFTNRSVLESLEPGRVAPWYALDAAYLHRYLIDELLETQLGSAPKVRYVKSVEAAKAAAREQAGVALLVAATPMKHLRAVSEAGGLMPQKSTFFFPKLATGLTLNPLE